MCQMQDTRGIVKTWQVLQGIRSYNDMARKYRETCWKRRNRQTASNPKVWNAPHAEGARVAQKMKPQWPHVAEQLY